MTTLLLQNFISHISQDTRLVQAPIYAELGALIMKHCAVDPNKPLPQKTKNLLASVFMLEFDSAGTFLDTYDKFGFVLTGILESDRYNTAHYHTLIASFLEAAKLDLGTQEEIESFDEAVSVNFGEAAGSDRRKIFGLAFERICSTVPCFKLTGVARRNLRAILIPVFMADLHNPIFEQSRQMLVVQDAKMTWNRRRYELIECRRDLAELTRISNFWLGLSSDDHLKSNCIILVGLLESLSEDGAAADYTGVDCLNSREHTFQVPIPPTKPFYDGDF